MSNSTHPAHTVPPDSGSPPPAAGAELKVQRLTGDIQLVVPPGCHASVLLKLVHRNDGTRFYAWWAMVGRHDMDTNSVPYKFTGEETIRFDLPEGVPLSAASLQPHLKKFLDDQHDADDEGPVIIEH